MSISRKLLFLLCITFTYNVIAMKKNSIGETACYQMLRSHFHEPFDEAKNKMQLGEYHTMIEKTLKSTFEENLPKGQSIGKIETIQVDFGTNDEDATIYNSMYRSQYKLHAFEAQIINGQKTRYIRFIDLLPYELTAKMAEKIENYERFKKIISDSKLLNSNQKSKLQLEIGSEFDPNHQLENDIIKLRENINKERLLLKKEKEELKKQEYEIKKQINEFKYVAESTFWNRNPTYTFGAGFLGCGLLGLYICLRENAGTIISDAMDAWRKH